MLLSFKREYIERAAVEYHSTGSLDPTGAARDEVYVSGGSNTMGGN